MRRARFVVWALAFTAVAACGKKKDEAKDEAPSLYGQWSGTHYVKKGSDGELITNKVTLLLDRDGHFTIKEKELSKEAVGEFSEFAGDRSLTLIVQESSFMEFGLRAHSYQYLYNLTADALVLNSTDATLRLKREKGADAVAGRGLEGRWECRDNTGGLWSLQVKDATAVILASRKGPATRMEADLSVNDKAGQDGLLRGEFLVRKSTPATGLLGLGFSVNAGSSAPRLELTPRYEEGKSGAITTVSCARP